MDIARLGFSAATGDLKKAKADLDALVPSATKAEAATDKFNRAAAGITTNAKGASTGIRSFESAVMGASARTDRLGKAALYAGTAMGTVQRAAVGASAGIGDIVTVTTRMNSQMLQADAHVEAYRASLAKIPPAAAGATSSLQRLGAAANDNINRLQSTPGNIAAQFQDIGVTAAAGMNPMLIGLQQGTQLSSAMYGGIGNLIAGFRQLFSVTTILTVGLVALAAAGLQNVDWMKLAKSLLHGLADAMEQFAVAAAYAGVVLAIAFAPQIITWIVTMTVQIGTMLVGAIVKATGAMLAFAVANPFAAIVIAIGLVIGAMILLNDTFGGVFTDILAWIRKAANFIIGGFVGAFNAIKATWKMLPAAIGDYVIQTANYVLKTVENMVNGVISLINGMTARLPFGMGENMQIGEVSFGQIDNPWAGAADKVNGIVSAEMGKAQGVDYVGGIIEGVQSAAGWAADKLRGFADGLGGEAGKGKAGKAKGGGAKGGKSELEKIAKAYEDLIAATEKRIAALNVETTALGMSEHAARLYRNEQDLIAQALEKNIPLTDTVRQKLGELAQTLTDAELAKVTAEATKAFEDQQKALKDQADLIGLTGLELAFNVEYQRLLNQATKDGKVDLANMNDEMRQYVALLGERAMALALDQTVNADAEFLDKETKAHKERMIAMQRERGEIGLTGAALEKYRLDTELLVEAERGIASPETIEKMRKMGYEHIELTEAVRRQREEIEFNRNTFRGFIEDMIGGLRQGQSVWEAFGNAVLNVVNKIIDRLLDQALDGLFNNKDGSSGGLLASIGNLFVKTNALGGAYGNSSIERFANGGAFTNGIYNNPTLFKFAKGGALGMMGEAGPEAVMPLKRGPDGSLGVQMHGPQTVNVQIGVNDDRFNAYVDDRSGMQIAAAAPTIASAGGKVAQANMAAQRRRSIT